ncbi:hypothetical protein EL84_22550 [Paenibacillus sp. VT-400]|nr:hypothetical protein EL84_22550 [Paenibacillus sp. VT-400]MCP1427153.1 hypothetical protein [Paenibacillus xylanexedens]
MLSEEDYAKVAKEALHQYPIYWEKLVYLGKSDNVKFQVQTNDASKVSYQNPYLNDFHSIKREYHIRVYLA